MPHPIMSHLKAMMRIWWGYDDDDDDDIHFENIPMMMIFWCYDGMRGIIREGSLRIMLGCWSMRNKWNYDDDEKMIKIVLRQLHSPMIIIKRWWGVTSSTGGSGSNLNKRSNHEHRRSQRRLSRCPFWQQNSNCPRWRLWQWGQHRWQQRPAKPTATSADSIFASLFHFFWQQGLDQAVQLSRHLPFHSFLLQSFQPLSSPPFFPHKFIWNKLFSGQGSFLGNIYQFESLTWECQGWVTWIQMTGLANDLSTQALLLLLYLTLWL